MDVALRFFVYASASTKDQNPSPVIPGDSFFHFPPHYVVFIFSLRLPIFSTPISESTRFQQPEEPSEAQFHFEFYSSSSLSVGFCTIWSGMSNLFCSRVFFFCMFHFFGWLVYGLQRMICKVEKWRKCSDIYLPFFGFLLFLVQVLVSWASARHDT